jgi:hypothetical protein
MKKHKLIFLLILVSIFLLITNCNPTEPPDDELKPGRRDYNWTVDTLKPAEGRSIPSRMWGADANDVWAVGLSYLNAYCIWHYDGKTWSNYTPDQYMDPRAIWGTSINNIWIGSTDGAFWHYDGVKWDKFSETTIPNYQQFIVQSMCGRSANEIYAIGFADSSEGNSFKAIIMHFNGVKWEITNIPSIKKSFKEIYYDKNDDIFYISAWEFNSSIESIYSFDGQNLNLIYSTDKLISLSNIGQEIISIIDYSKIYKVKSGTIELIKDFSATSFAGYCFGRNELDIITANDDGIGHFNGNDLLTIYPKWNIELNRIGSIIFEKDFYYIWEDSYKTFIVHGKLK